MVSRLFVYGTLMDESIVRSVCGRVFATQPARLRDYERLAPPRDYPFVRPRAGASVDGLVLLDVDDSSLARLDEYEDEGRLYERRSVVVDVAGESVAAFVYARLPARGSWSVDSA